MSNNSDSVPEEIDVTVSFVQSNEVDLASQGIDRKQARILRDSLEVFSTDWESPEMAIYDDYDAAKAKAKSEDIAPN